MRSDRRGRTVPGAAILSPWRGVGGVAMNQAFLDSMHDAPFSVVRAQGVAARNRMLRAWRSLPEDSSEADRWIREAGPDHYAEHLPRLRE